MILPQNHTIFNEIDTFAPKCGPRPVQLIFEPTSMQYLFDRLQATQKNCRIYFKQKWNSKMQSMRRPFLYVVFCGMAVLGTFREQVAMASEHPAAPEARILDDILPPANRHATWKPHLWRGIITPRPCSFHWLPASYSYIWGHTSLSCCSHTNAWSACQLGRQCISVAKNVWVLPCQTQPNVLFDNYHGCLQQLQSLIAVCCKEKRNIWNEGLTFVRFFLFHECENLNGQPPYLRQAHY